MKFFKRKTIHDFAKTGNLSRLKVATQKGADLNLKDSFGMTPFHYAVKEENYEIIEFLIAQKADINLSQNERNIACGINGFTPLLFALHYENRELGIFLINAGANINCKSAIGITPLHYAVKSGDIELTNLLIEKKADLNAQKYGVRKNELDDTPLHIASIEGNYKIAEKLLKSGANPNIKGGLGRTPLHNYNKDSRTIKLLIDYGANVNLTDCFGNTPAMETSNSEKLRLLIKAGAKLDILNEKGETALNLATNTNVIKILLEEGMKIEPYALFSILRYQYNSAEAKLSILSLFIEKGANLNIKKGGATILHYLAHVGITDDKQLEQYPNVLELLQVIDVNVQDIHKETALHWAAYNNAVNWAKILVNNNANIFIRNNEKKTALDIAKQEKSIELENFLIEYIQINI